MNVGELKEYTDKEVRGTHHRISALQKDVSANTNAMNDHEKLCENRHGAINTHLVWIRSVTGAILAILVGGAIYLLTGQWPA